MKKLFIRFSPALLALFVLSVPLLAFADDSFVPLTNLPGIQEAAKTNNLPDFLNTLYKLCIGVAATLAVLQIMYAGYTRMTSFGNAGKVSEANKRIQQALLGLVLVLSPALVFSIINPDILKLNLDFSSLRPSDNGGGLSSGNSVLQKDGGAICAQYTQLKYIPTGDASSCNKTLGNGWAGVNCGATPPKGQMACGFSKSNVTPDTTVIDPSKNSGVFSLDLYVQDTNYDTGGACVVSTSARYKTENECLAALTATRPSGKYAVSNNCNGKLGVPAPAASYAALEKLPECPK